MEKPCLWITIIGQSTEGNSETLERPLITVSGFGGSLWDHVAGGCETGRARAQSSDLRSSGCPYSEQYIGYCRDIVYLEIIYFKPLPPFTEEKIKAQKSSAQDDVEQVKSGLILKHLIPSPKHWLLLLLLLSPSFLPVPPTSIISPSILKQPVSFSKQNFN